MTDATITQRVEAAREKGREHVEITSGHGLYGGVSYAALDRLIALERLDAHTAGHQDCNMPDCNFLKPLLAAIEEIERAV